MSTAPKMIENGPSNASTALILAHGAGAPMDTAFMETVALGVAKAGVRVLRFEFPYMTRRREDGKRRPPDRQPVLLECWRSVFKSVQSERVVIGGKSMGGRMASLIADEVGAAALICLGYPFHPPGKPDRLRTEHLRDLVTPTLILQGERDPLGTMAEVAGYALSGAIHVHWLGDGNHDLAPRKKSGRTNEQNMSEATDAITTFLKERTETQ
jgi:uncharacterized protein